MHSHQCHAEKWGHKPFCNKHILCYCVNHPGYSPWQKHSLGPFAMRDSAFLCIPLVAPGVLCLDNISNQGGQPTVSRDGPVQFWVMCPWKMDGPWRTGVTTCLNHASFFPEALWWRRQIWYKTHGTFSGAVTHTHTIYNASITQCNHL